jgi:hypothetical protein
MFGVLGDESYTRGHVSRGTQVSEKCIRKGGGPTYREQRAITTLSYVGIRTER